jgi:predicted aldo/keto reductase-like oxidoreductase
MEGSRREFIKKSLATAGTVGALSISGDEALAEDAQAPPAPASTKSTSSTNLRHADDALPRRVLGRTRERVTILGIGVAPLGSDKTTIAEAEAVVQSAIDQGIRYLDVSPDYGNAEAKLKGVLKRERERVFLVTKVNPDRQDRAGVQKQLEESLARMGVDDVDAVHIHNLGDFDMARLFTPDGAIAGLKEARKRGLVRFVGTSGHMRPSRFVTAIETGDIDLTMNALNFADRNHYAFEDLVIPAARKHGTAVVAMKVLGGAKNWQYDGRTQATLADHHSQAIRYSLGLPGVACAVIGLSSAEEIRQAVEVARHFKPLEEAEKAALLQTGKELSVTRGLYYGPITG